MSLAEVVSVLKLIQGGVFAVFAFFYTVSLFHDPATISGRDRKRFTRKMAVLGWAFALDFIISGLVGGTTSYIAAGGALWPVCLLLFGRALSIVYGLALLYTSWRLWDSGPP